MENESNKSQMHIKINVFRILSYLIVYGIFGVLLFIYLRGYISLIILVVFIAIPLFEIYITSKLSKAVRVVLNVSDERVFVHERLGIGISVENKSIFSGLNLLCEIDMNNIYFDTIQSQKVDLPIHPRKSISHPIIFDTCTIGLIRIEMVQYTISDVFGFISIINTCNDKACYVKILPSVNELKEEVRESLVLGVNDNEDNTKKGNELTQTGNIREYIPGDRIKDIHWKLSAKRDMLLVKERISTSESRLVLWVGSSNGRKLCEGILSLALEIMNSCVEEGRFMEVYWYDFHSSNVEHFAISDRYDIDSAFEKIYFSGHGEQPDSIMNLLTSDGYNFNSFLGVVFTGDEIRVNLYEA